MFINVLIYYYDAYRLLFCDITSREYSMFASDIIFIKETEWCGGNIILVKFLTFMPEEKKCNAFFYCYNINIL